MPLTSIQSGVYFFIGGPLLFIAGILEFFLGNTFPFVVFMTYGTAALESCSIEAIDT